MKYPVVVVGGSANALGILRSLAKFDLTLLCDNQTAPAWHSRWGKKVLAQNTKSEHVIADLLQLAKTYPFKQKPVLLLTEEKTVVHVSAQREQLAQYYQFNFVDHALMLQLQSKSGFQQLALQHNAKIPFGVVLQNLSDLSQIDQFVFPCVFKPLEQNEAYSRQFSKAYKVSSPAEVASLYQKIHPVMPQMILQEWLEGADSDIYFCLAYFDPSQQMVASFCGRKLRSWPLQIGGTASCTSAPEVAAELLAQTLSFAQAIGYVGQIGMEFKYDAQRGGFYMIEPTVGRTDYQHEIATLSGCNILAAQVASMFNLALPLLKPNNKVLWFDEIADANALAHGADPQQHLKLQKIAAIRRLADPMPWLYQFWQRIRRRLL